MQNEEQFRKPTPMEADFLRLLLSADFVGKSAITEQLDNCRVRVVDSEGSLEIQPGDSGGRATVEKRIPVEAEGLDEDGIAVHFLLHVVDGFAKELEVYKDDGSSIKRMPSPTDLKVIVLPA
jgi:hypothetical protein